jgi:hypothetical protein
MRSDIAAVLATALLLSACGGSSAVQSDARKTAAALTGDDTHAAADNPQCKLFTPVEVAKYIGESVTAGRNAMGGCQWVTTKAGSDGRRGDVMVIVVPARYHERPSLAPGFKEAPGIGEKGFAAQDMGGWIAGAIVGEDAVRVSARGAAASEASAIALLKETIARRAR